MQVAGLLVFSGGVVLFCLILDQFVDSQRPTRPLVALTMGPALIAAGCLLLRRSKPRALGADPSATPQPGAAAGPRTAIDLWALIIGLAVVFGLAIYGPFWGNPWLILGDIAFLGIWAVAISKPFMSELARRGDWVPPGTARHPVLVAIALTALLAAAVVAVLLTLAWVERLSGLAK
jgi:hypothetical protein